MVGLCEVQGKVLGFTSLQIAGILDVPYEGSTMYEKGKWLAEYKREVVLGKITNLDVIPRICDIMRSCMNVEYKVVHSYVKDDIIPMGKRRTHVGIIERTHVGIIDFMYMLILLERDHLHLSWISMKHMEHLKTNPDHALHYGALIKKLLEKSKAYEEGTPT